MIESSTDHPANAMYSNALAESFAVFEVVRPISKAASLALLYSSSFASAVALHELIAVSNSFPTLTLAVPIPSTAVPAAVAACTVVEIAFFKPFHAESIAGDTFFSASAVLIVSELADAASFAISFSCFFVNAQDDCREASTSPAILTANSYSFLLAILFLP